MASRACNSILLFGPFLAIINVVYSSVSDIKRTKIKSKAPRVTPLIYSRRIMISSSLIIFDVLYAFSLNNCMDFFILDLFCLITSINYWRDARKDWRRTFDIIVTMPLFLYHVFIACMEFKIHVFEKYIYLLLTLCIFTMYYSCTKIKSKKIGQLVHSSMHIVGVPSNVFMYYYLSLERLNVSQYLESPLHNSITV